MYEIEQINYMYFFLAGQCYIGLSNIHGNWSGLMLSEKRFDSEDGIDKWWGHCED